MAAPAQAPPLGGKANQITIATIAVVLVAYALLIYSRRWLSDDGLIDVRVVRQVLAGNGPTFNAFERSEPNTSALWTWLLVLVAEVTRGNVSQLAVICGAVLALVGALVGMDAARRWHRLRGAAGVIVPAGALLLLAVAVFCDYATSGLEGSLVLAWCAACWWLLVLLTPAASRRYHMVFAIVVGLGPLVRPDMGLVSGVFLGAGWLVLRPAWRRTLALAGAAIAAPLAYEIFRGGYYGTLVPLPALAKSATSSLWDRGFEYLANYVGAYALWLPFVVLIAVLVGAIVRTRVVGRERIVLAAPLVAGVLSALYVLRVGGDFMHGRMFLPATFLLVLPAMMLPVGRWTAAPLAVLVAWAVWAGVTTRGSHGGHRIEDERAGYAKWTKNKHPVDDAAFIKAEGPLVDEVAKVASDGTRRFKSEGGVNVAMAPARPEPVVLAVGRLGVGGAVVPLDGIVADTLGLASPLGARITQTGPDNPVGHQKVLPWAWMFADFADPAMPVSPDATPVQIAAARHAMTCGDLAELLASVREPLTVGRFFANLTGSVRRTRLVIPSDPVAAEAEFCH